MILLDNLHPISPQEAKDRSLFGPVYHGSTSDRLEKINTQGFKVPIGHERSAEVSHGYEAGAYGYSSIPAPIHHLGFGVYFTTSKTIAKRFSYGNTKIGPYFLDIPRMVTINWGSPNTMMKWWIENGYDYKKTPETTYGSGKTDLYAIRQERIRSTLHLTETLKSKYDGVWYKGKGMYKLLDGDQVVIFDPNRVYKLDKTLIKPGEIGSKVVAKVGIDPYGRGEIKVPVGTKGIILDKKKPAEHQTWAEGSEFLYMVKFETGGVLYDLIDKWIEPYYRTKLRESIIQRRSFWKDYEKIYENTKISPISKEEELNALNYVKNLQRAEMPGFGKKIRKIKHDDFEIVYKTDVSITTLYIHITKNKNGISVKIDSAFDNVKGPEKIPFLENTDNPRLGKCYELSGRYVSRHPDSVLVHGRLNNPHVDNKKYMDQVDHSWVEENDEIYDPVTDARWTKDDFERIYKPVVYKKYSYIEVLKCMMRYKHWGPWDDIKKSVNESTKKPYYNLTKQEEQEALRIIILGGIDPISGHSICKSIHKIDQKQINDGDIIRDEATYEFIADPNRDDSHSLNKVKISKNDKEAIYRLVKSDGTFYGGWYPTSDIKKYLDQKNPTELKENDYEHSKALHQTGYWGRQGAGAIILAKDTGRILLPLRSRLVEQPNTWGVWGGAIDDKEDPASAVRRELSEEVGHHLHIDELLPMYVFEDLRVGFRYSNFLAVIPNEFTPRLNWETQKTDWVEFGKLPFPMHFGLKALLQNSGDQILKEVRKYSK